MLINFKYPREQRSVKFPKYHCVMNVIVTGSEMLIVV